MSQTTTPPPVTPAGTIPAGARPTDSLISPQFLLAMYGMTMVAGILGVVIMRGDAAQTNSVLGFAFSLGSGIAGFYFGSSKSSQSKDDALTRRLDQPPEGITVVPSTSSTTTVETP